MKLLIERLIINLEGGYSMLGGLNYDDLSGKSLVAYQSSLSYPDKTENRFLIVPVINEDYPHKGEKMLKQWCFIT